MKNKTNKMLEFLIGIPFITIIFIISVLYVKINFDFPANKNGYDDLVEKTNVKIKNNRVFVRYTGWGDTQTYLKFSATPEEIDRIIKSKQLSPTNTFTKTSSFYWWKPQPSEGCEYFENKKGSEWTWLYYDPGSKHTYYFATTF